MTYWPPSFMNASQATKELQSRLERARENAAYWKEQFQVHNDYIAKEALADANRLVSLLEGKGGSGHTTTEIARDLDTVNKAAVHEEAEVD